jgi:hypothetical protein
MRSLVVAGLLIVVVQMRSSTRAQEGITGGNLR